MLAAVAHDINWWSTIVQLIVASASIIFFIKKILIKFIASELKELKKETDNKLNNLEYKVSPNGGTSQNIGDIASRTETKVDNLYSFMERYAIKVDDLEKDVAYLTGSFETFKDNLSRDNVTH